MYLIGTFPRLHAPLKRIETRLSMARSGFVFRLDSVRLYAFSTSCSWLHPSPTRNSLVSSRMTNGGGP
jgi:hypothetical protein